MDFDRKKYKQFAKEQLKGRWSVPVLATLVTSIIIIFLVIIEKISTTDIQTLYYSSSNFLDFIRLLFIEQPTKVSLLYYLILICEVALEYIIEIALIILFITLSRSPDKISFSNFFEGFNYWSRGILCGLWVSLWIFLWTFPCVFAASLIYMIFATLNILSESAVLVAVLILICLIPLYMKSLSYSQAFYLVAEFPELSIRKALRISITITKGHLWDIFVTQLSFIGWSLLSVLTLYVGFLWLSPYMRMTNTNVFHALLKDALETQKINPEDLQ